MLHTAVTPPATRALRPDLVVGGHQQIDEVVDHDRDLCSINRLKPDRPIRFDSHDPLTLQSSALRRAPETRAPARISDELQGRLGLDRRLFLAARIRRS